MADQVRREAEINRLFELYLPKLTRLAESRLSGKMGPKFDGEDISATVCRTVWRRFREGVFVFDDDVGFWRLLVTIAIRKISNKARQYKTQARSLEHEVPVAANDILSTPEPGPDEAAAFEELLQKLLYRLDETEQQVFRMRIQNYQFQEIADRINKSEKTARRKMAVIKEKLTEIFDETCSERTTS